MKEVEPYGGWLLAERRKGGHKHTQEKQLLDCPNLHFSEVILESITFAPIIHRHPAICLSHSPNS